MHWMNKLERKLGKYAIKNLILYVQSGVETTLKVSDHILDAVERLETFPDSGSLIPDEWLNQKGYRMVICERHVAVYRQIGQVIYVYHIADTRTGYTKLFDF